MLVHIAVFVNLFFVVFREKVVLLICCLEFIVNIVK